MKNSLLLLGAFFLFLSCNSDDDSQGSILDGRTYTLSSLVIDVGVDIDGDGVFNQDVLLEDLGKWSFCFEEYSIEFDKEIFRHPFDIIAGISVWEVNGNPEQNFGCAVISFENDLSYSLDNDIFKVFSGSNLWFEGNLTGDQLIFDDSNGESILAVYRYLDSANEIQEYHGGVTAIFTLE